KETEMRWMLPILGAAVLGLMLTVASTAADRTAAKAASTPPARTSSGGSVIDIPGNTLLDPGKEKVVRTEAEWHKILTPEQYYVTREKGTERAFTGQYEHWTAAGTFVCVACGNPLFSSETKFDSGTGWPSFFAPLSPKAVHTESDWTLGMK